MKYKSYLGSDLNLLDDHDKDVVVATASGCKVFINDALASVGALKEGDEVVVTGSPATEVKAIRAAVKEPEPAKAEEKPKAVEPEEEEEHPHKKRPPIQHPHKKSHH